ncbi:hypothetical protein CE91St30_04160 [Raoultibacter timonensis]|uniref:Uncharacterized protein n=1 Tax=Raoultibacter timonensis TaxID=1907662 RepID=A0ABN6MEW8_9ACTN|nr:hypothetical protein CE91St30_04160 [Raoultibacter timonensis]BDF49686.1 hypothetical protein CE91St31_04160 [Raoultibacter timonensis]
MVAVYHIGVPPLPAVGSCYLSHAPPFAHELTAPFDLGRAAKALLARFGSFDAARANPIRACKSII